MNVEPMIASCRCRAESGGTPFLLIKDDNPPSARLAPTAHAVVFSLKLSLESI